MKESNRVNIRDIAKRAGVSVASVSRALNETQAACVSPKLKQKISEICEDMKYFPNMHMVRMHSNRANTIAFIFPPKKNTTDMFEKGGMDPNLGAVITGVEEVLSNDSIYLTLASATEKFLENKEYLKFFRSKMVDGMILWGWTDNEGPYLQELIDENVPLVMVQCGDPQTPVNQVVARDYEGMLSIVDHIVTLGHRKIALAAPLPIGLQAKERLNGMIDGLKKHQLEPSYISEGGYSFEFGYKAGCDIIKNAPQTTCIMAANDMAAKGIISAALKNNIDVPGQLSVTGADGLKFTEEVQLTTFITPSHQLGIAGAEAIKKAIDSPDAKSVKSRLPVTFMEGNTTACVS